MDEEQLIALAVANWKRIGETLLAVDSNHSEKYYQVVPMLLDQALVSPFRIVASYCSSDELKSQFDDGITTSAIIWNCWLTELAAVTQTAMLMVLKGDQTTTKQFDISMNEINRLLQKICKSCSNSNPGINQSNSQFNTNDEIEESYFDFDNVDDAIKSFSLIIVNTLSMLHTI